MSFVELLARSSFSFLEGASQPGELALAAHALGMDALAICDRNGLYGLPRALSAIRAMAKETPPRTLRLVVGVELELEDEETRAPLGSIAILVEDEAGYAKLSRLITRAHASHEKGAAGLSRSALASEGGQGLFVILPIELAWRAKLEATVRALRDAFADRLFSAVWRERTPEDEARIRVARGLEARLGVLPLASARPLYHERSRRPLLDVVTCIREGTTLDAAGTRLAVNAERCLLGHDAMRARFPDDPAWIERTGELAARCRFSLEDVRYRFPSERACLPGEGPDGALRRVVEEGCRRRYPGGVPARVRAQLERELALIQQLEVAPYFLSVHEIVELAREKRILCQGRGSAANSAVCYVIGVTAVDPARHEMLFERFLSAERAEPPDIDVDFEHERREEVIQAIYRGWGRERAAMAAAVIAYRGKSALREVGKVFGLPDAELGRLARLAAMRGFEWANPEDLADSRRRDERLRDLGFHPEDARLRQILALASQLRGLPRHLSIHTGGFILSSEPLDRVSPIEPARMEGRTVIPWDKDDLDTLGFFKVDVLALGMLTAIRKTLATLHERGELAGSRDPATGAPLPFDPIEALARIPPEDPRVYEAIARADTVGVFQIESRAQRAMLPRLRPRTFYDLVIEVAIVRPGPIQGGMIHPYLRRRMGEERPDAPHPSLEPILARTLGVPIFQEQVMRLAMDGAGYTPGEADQLRRDMAAWRRGGDLARHRERLLAGFAKKGIEPSFAERLYEQILGFAEYGFPESHAASFALLVYASAWLKVHHPAAFLAALLNSQPMGFYSASSLVQDAREHGVEVLASDVGESGWDTRVLGEPAVVRLGLRQIVGLRREHADAIVLARGDGPFVSIADLRARTRLEEATLDRLASAGALSSLEPDRRQAMWRARARAGEGLFRAVELEPPGSVSGLEPMTRYEQLLLDYAHTRLSVEDHPLAHLRASLRARGVCTARELGRLPHHASATVAGLVIGRQRPVTSSGVTFVTLEDETGVANLVVWRDVFEAHFRLAAHAMALVVHGRVERQELPASEAPVVHLVARRFERLEVPGLEGVRSRDFH